ncbi:pseudomurein-binding repeat-containing protein [Methanobacterium sp. ACI-7]|uniref:pseudomurein-binding repeat-containing protein n=1 Tax=unclassified Methanobacterium TaxID=2627676 RepID=UPI0039C05BEE
MGIGGGIITKKTLFAVLLIVSLSFGGMSNVSALELETVQTQTNTTSTVQEEVNTQNQSVNNVTKSTITQNPTNSSLKINETTNYSQNSTNITTTTRNTTNITNSSTNPVSSTQQTAAIVTTTQTISSSFTLSEIKDAAARVKSFVETNKALPRYVTINTVQVKMTDFLKLLTAALLQINSGSTTPIALKTVNGPSQPYENVVSGNIYKSGYLDLAKRVNAYISTNGAVPNYATSTLGKLRYESLIYMYSKILNYQKVNNTLPNYVSVNAWRYIATSTTAKPVYITSDNINGYTTDMNRINAIVSGLRNLGLTAINWGLGPNTHISVLQSSSVPSNALVVDIYGGACAGTIYEMGTTYYKRLVGTREVFSVWIPPATDITGLAWLPRSRDDNFSPSGFTGLAHPDQYLINNGYSYIYSGDISTIISSIYREATTA